MSFSGEVRLRRESARVSNFSFRAGWAKAPVNTDQKSTGTSSSAGLKNSSPFV